MKKIINIYILLSSIFMLKLNGQGIFDRNDSLKIEIVKPDINSEFMRLFIRKEVLDTNFSGIKQLKCDIPFEYLNDLDYGKHVEDYENTPVKINAFIEYSLGVKIKIIAYYENGQQYGEAYFNKKGRDGIQKYWYDNGQVESFYLAKNGIIISPITEWYKNGMLKSFQDEISSKNIMKEWYKNGVLGKEIIFEDTSYNANSFIEKSYYDNGNPLIMVHFNNGQQPFKMYYKNGKLCQEGDILGTLLARVGKWQEWYESGQLKQESYYHDTIPNYRIGTWKYWNEKGELIKEEKYENGELIDTKEYLPMKIKN